MPLNKESETDQNVDKTELMCSKQEGTISI